MGGAGFEHWGISGDFTVEGLGFLIHKYMNELYLEENFDHLDNKR